VWVHGKSIAKRISCSTARRYNFSAHVFGLYLGILFGVFDAHILQQARAMARVLALSSGALEVVLFGSRARGDFDDSSDWDFLLILPDGAWMFDFEAELEIVRTAQKALWDAGFDVYADVIPMPSSVYQKGTNSLVRIVTREGISVFGAIHA
jgi:uncharacterized protein